MPVVLEELGEHLATADRLAGDYARQLLGVEPVDPWYPDRGSRPPRGLHPKVAALVREIVAEAA